MGGQILIKDKQARILMALKDSTQNWYISSLAKSANTTYVHACNFLLDCERLGITKSEKHGKIKTIKLTEKGGQIVDSLNTIYGAIGDGGAEQGNPARQKPVEEKKAA